MPTADAAHLLGLVNEALERFEVDPLPASVRRALRIARLNGDESESVRFAMELDYDAGSKLLDGRDGPEHVAFLENRSLGVESRLLGLPEGIRHTLEPLDTLCRDPEPPAIQLSQRTLSHRQNVRNVAAGIVAGVRSFTWDYLSRRETELRVSTAAEQIFNQHRIRVDRLLGAAAPVVLERLSAALSRAESAEPEARAHALTSCRRVLAAVADVVFPAQEEPWRDGAGIERPVGRNQYRNRLLAAVERVSVDGSHRRALSASLSEFATRLDRLDELSSKGVHDHVTDAEMRHGVIHTYLLAGEILNLCGYDRTSGGGDD